jgi:hypothetical protein
MRQKPDDAEYAGRERWFIVAKPRNSGPIFERTKILTNKHNDYFQVYDHVFEKFIDKEITFVEIGVFHGGSLLMWREYFGDKARIIGIDINPNAKKAEELGFEIFIGDQAKPEFWAEFFEQIGPVDIVLDDGGHCYDEQITTTECCIPHIKDGGLLVVEDTHTSYMQKYGYQNEPTSIDYAKGMIDRINFRAGALKEAQDTAEWRVWAIRILQSFVIFDVHEWRSRFTSLPVTNFGEEFIEGARLGTTRSPK